MVLRHTVHYFCGNPYFYITRHRVRRDSLLIGDDFADVMKQTPKRTTLTSAPIPELMQRRFCFLHGMGDHILTERIPILKSSEHCNKRRRQIIHRRSGIASASSEHDPLGFFLHLLYEFFNASRLHSAIPK